jgi:folate-binding protein YgfZ
MTSPDWINEYQSLTQRAGLVDFAERTQVELKGPDRISFLHNFCTADIRHLAPGAGCEAFITSVQGKTIGHVLVFNEPEVLILETVPGQGERLRQHFDHYLIREKVEVVDRSHGWAEWLLAGAQAAEVLHRAMSHGDLPTGHLESQLAEFAQTPVWLRRVDLAGPVGYLVTCLRGDEVRVGRLLCEAGAERCRYETFHAVRIEAGFPLFGHDITDKNLPQEVARDRQAISFNKGCYLGQETVARIDALGHVNRLLVGLRFLGDELPKLTAELTAGEQVAGHLTSVTWSPKLRAPLALGYVRRGCHEVGTRLGSGFGPAEVVELPIA